MYRSLAITLFISVNCIQLVHAQSSASFNFSAASTTPISGWVNISGDPSTGIRSGSSGSITISSVSMANWAPIPGTGSAFNGVGASPGVFFPTAVMANHWFQYSILGGYNAAVPQLQIGGLDKDSVYTIKMTGSSTSSFSTNPTQYTVAGRTVDGYIDINTHSNTTAGATFNNIAPDTNGTIRVYINTVPSTDVGDICGIQITRGHTNPPPMIFITSPANNDVLSEDGNVTINAAASESGGSIVKVQFFVGDTTKIGEATSPPYAATWVTPDEGHYKVTATAVDALGVSNSTSINVSVESLSGYWSMTGNIAANADTNFLGTVDTNRLAIRTNNIERLSVMGDGTVGIGTKNTYGYKLAVNGNAIFTKVRIRAYNAWPDYVFKKDYKLPGIDELEKYILLYRHLPGMTPASEVNNKGMDIADEQAALLKKIEELTLYIIQEHKNVQKLAGEVKMLRLQNQRLKQQKKTGRK